MDPDLAHRITGIETCDVRFPTSLSMDGSDAMHDAPDYSLAYVVVRTDAPDGLAGHGFAFTLGRGTEVQVAAIEAFAPLVAGLRLDETLADMGLLWRRLVGDSHLRWLGPEKGVVHMAAGAVVNALWDLRAKRAGKPLWKLLADMPPEELVALVDFRHLTDALTPDEALALLRERAPGSAERERRLLADGLPAYTTSPGWLAYPDAKLRRLLGEAIAAGFSQVKVKVGAGVEDDVRRCAIAREVLGSGRRLMVDANQIWDVHEAVDRIHTLERFDPWWIEEPTSPDDILGYAAIARAVAPTRIAGGEHVHNRVMFKQLLKAGAIGFCQVDPCRLAGVNEVVAVMLMAAKSGVPVCPHGGGVGLCEMIQHLSAFDYVALGGELEDRTVEYVDHLHEHFVDPCVVEKGRYRMPSAPGYSTEMLGESQAAYAYPHGAAWAPEAGLIR
jgi:L-fuconate dehydratase